MRSIDFSSPFIIENLGLLYRKPASSSKLWSFLDPLHGYVWLGVVLTVFVGATVLLASELVHVDSKTLDSNPLADRSEMLRSAKLCLFNAMNSPFGTQEYQPRSSLGKLAQWLVAFFFLIVLATYTANLASFLTVQTPSRVETADSLLAQAGGGGPRRHRPPHRGPQRHGDQRGFPRGQPQRPGGAPRGRVRGVDAESTDYALQPALRLFVAAARRADPFWHFKRKIDEKILELTEYGTLDAWSKAGLPADQCSSAVLSSSSITFGNLSGIFLLCGVGMALLVLLSVLRLVFCKPELPVDADADDSAVKKYQVTAAAADGTD